MTVPMTVPFVVAMAQPAQGQGNILIQLFPFVLMIGIFYLLVLMPMRYLRSGHPAVGRDRAAPDCRQGAH